MEIKALMVRYESPFNASPPFKRMKEKALAAEKGLADFKPEHSDKRKNIDKF